MNALRYTAQVLREFAHRWGSYLLLVGLVSGVTDGVVLPLLRWSAAKILVTGGVPYLSYDNAWATAVHHPGVMLALAALLLLVLVLVYLQFAWFLGGVDNIRRRAGQRFSQVLWEGLHDLRHLRWDSFGFFVLYLLLIVPFAGNVVGSSLLAKVQIPTFIMDWLTTKPLFAVLIAVFYLAMGYLGIRWLRVLPNAILGDQPLRVAARQSWQQTRGHFWYYLLRSLMLAFTLAVLTYAWSALWIAVQTWADGYGFAFVAAIITTSVLLIGKMALWGLSSVVYLLFLSAPDDIHQGQGPDLPPVHRWLRRWAVIVFGAASLTVIAAFGGAYMYGAMDYQPLTISHRGVDNGNGVQNTIPALQKTAAEHPDYVEMDLHETKDGQFLVLHDENLKALAGVDKTPHQLTLAELTRLTVRENGHQAKLASFDAYLAAAERLHQKLLVEIKPTKQDSPQMVAHFAKRYGKRLQQDGDRVHSLSYTVLTQLHRAQPKLYESFIMPYSLIFPQTRLQAYTVEESTLDDSFIDSAHAHHQQVLAWTINDPDEMDKMLFIGADGIITDNLHALQARIRAHTDHPAYAQRLRVFSDTLNDFDQNPVVEN